MFLLLELGVLVLIFCLIYRWMVGLDYFEGIVNEIGFGCVLIFWEIIKKLNCKYVEVWWK